VNPSWRIRLEVVKTFTTLADTLPEVEVAAQLWPAVVELLQVRKTYFTLTLTLALNL